MILYMHYQACSYFYYMCLTVSIVVFDYCTVLAYFASNICINQLSVQQAIFLNLAILALTLLILGNCDLMICNKFNAAFLIISMFCGALPFLILLLSSPNVTSSVQCSAFSIIQ